MTPRPPPASRAFTLLEMLIVIGVVSLLAVGLGVIFSAVGKTVDTGKRVSTLNAFANSFEQAFRRDFESLTRDGYMVIVNELTGDGNLAVPRFAGDENPVPRRIDQIMFFTAGPSTSARQPVDPRFVASGNAARVYYGHGIRRNKSDGLAYIDGALDDPNNRPGFGLGENNTDNPNRYASEWILLRHETLLRQPLQTDPTLADPTNLPFGLRPREVDDTDTQVALTPAASSSFRRLAAVFPWGPQNDFGLYGGVKPQFSSGMVDAASTDLAEIRSIVTTTSILPDQVKKGPNFDDQPTGKFKTVTSDSQAISRMQAWMIDGLPTNSVTPLVADRVRIRCEAGPPDLLDAMGESDDATRAVRTANQLMLMSSNFGVRCTQFIVEWSFAGDDYYGMGRSSDIDGDGQIDPEEWSARPYGTDLDGDGDIEQQTLTYYTNAGAKRFHRVRTDLIHGTNNPGQPNTQLVSYFGYLDPSFEPDADADGVIDDPGDAANATLPWAWPRSVRITMTLAAPDDPSISETYQFELTMPDRPGA